MRNPHEAALRRRHGMSPERREALKTFNAAQTYHGVCRVCGTHWRGLLRDLPARCASCGAGSDGE